jgi:hypothetical protein
MTARPSVPEEAGGSDVSRHFIHFSRHVDRVESKMVSQKEIALDHRDSGSRSNR